MRRFLILIIYVLITAMYCCTSETRYPKSVLESLELAGKNRNNLIGVLENYQINNKDSLKYLAACFLISNMKDHYSDKLLPPTPSILEKSFKHIDSLTKELFFAANSAELFKLTEFMHFTLDNNDFVPTKGCIDSLIRIQYGGDLGIFSLKTKYDEFEKEVNTQANELLSAGIEVKAETGIFYDLETISSEWLINHIDNAFNRWKSSKFARSMTFEEFLELLLPYRSRNEALDKMSSEYFSRMKPLLESDSLSINQVVERLNFYIYCLDYFEDEGKNLGPLGFYDLLQFYKYDCDRHSEWMVRMLNACGIPAYLEYTSGFYNRDKIHYGVSVRDTDGQYHHFTPKWQMLGDTIHAKMFSKIFRRTFSPQKCPYTMKGKDEEIPIIFGDPFIKDVTENYHKVCSLTLPIDSIPNQNIMAYLAIFSPSGWKPVGWGTIDRKMRTMSFDKVPVDAMYIAGIWESDNLTPLCEPFYLSQNGKQTFLSPDFDHKVTIHAKRKYPEKDDMIKYMKITVGAKIEGANKPDFSDAVTLHVLQTSDLENFDERRIDLRVKKPLRYIRCLARPGTRVNIAEMNIYGEFTDNSQDSTSRSMPRTSKLQNMPFGTQRIYQLKGTPISDGQRIENAFDGNLETFANSFSIGSDLLMPQTIKSIAIAPRNSNNGITPGNSYQLFYYDHGWVDAGVQTATGDFVDFVSVPSKTLYWLRNLSAGKEELSFIYKEGEQIFVNNGPLNSLN